MKLEVAPCYDYDDCQIIKLNGKEYHTYCSGTRSELNVRLKLELKKKFKRGTQFSSSISTNQEPTK